MRILYLQFCAWIYVTNTTTLAGEWLNSSTFHVRVMCISQLMDRWLFTVWVSYKVTSTCESLMRNSCASCKSTWGYSPVEGYSVRKRSINLNVLFSNMLSDVLHYPTHPLFLCASVYVCMPLRIYSYMKHYCKFTIVSNITTISINIVLHITYVGITLLVVAYWL